MKKINASTWIGMGVGLLVPLCSSAEIKTGFFEGKFKNGGDASVYIQSTGQADKGAVYGIIVKEGSKAVSAGGLFRIEELLDGTQAWVRQFQGEQGFLRSKADQSASFKGVYDASTNKLKLTSVGAGCESFEVIAKLDTDQDWVPIPQSGIFKNKEAKDEILVNGDSASGNMTLDKSHDGSFYFSKLMPSLASIKLQVLDSKAISGYSLGRKVIGVAFAVVDKGVFTNDTYLKAFSVDENICLGALEALEMQ